MIRQTKVQVVPELMGGRGTCEVHHIISDNELYNHIVLYAKVVVKPNASIGWHQHVGETEPYYILEGEGIFVDNDGSRKKVYPGDVCTIIPGQYHAIENASEYKDMVFMALIHKTV